MSPTTTGVLDVRDIAPRERHTTVHDAFDALAVGAAFEVVDDRDPTPLFYAFEAECAGEFTWEALEQGPEAWRVRIGKT